MCSPRNQEWACSTKAPVDRNPFPEERYNPNSSPGALYLALRPGIESDEHLLPLHEGSWSQDGIHWFHAKICFIHGGCGPRKREANPTSGKYRGEELSTEYSRKAASWNSVSETAGLLVTLRPEGVGQKRVRLEKEARAFMSLEDERSRHVGAIFSRLQKEIKARVTRTQQSAVSLRRASAVAMTQVSETLSWTHETQIILLAPTKSASRGSGSSALQVNQHTLTVEDLVTKYRSRSCLDGKL